MMQVDGNSNTHTIANVNVTANPRTHEQNNNTNNFIRTSSSHSSTASISFSSPMITPTLLAIPLALSTTRATSSVSSSSSASSQLLSPPATPHAITRRRSPSDALSYVSLIATNSSLANSPVASLSSTTPSISVTTAKSNGSSSSSEVSKSSNNSSTPPSVTTSLHNSSTSASLSAPISKSSSSVALNSTTRRTQSLSDNVSQYYECTCPKITLRTYTATDTTAIQWLQMNTILFFARFLSYHFFLYRFPIYMFLSFIICGSLASSSYRVIVSVVCILASCTMLFLLFHRLAFLYYLRWTISEMSTISAKFFNASTRSHFWVAVLNTDEYNLIGSEKQTHNDNEHDLNNNTNSSDDNNNHNNINGNSNGEHETSNESSLLATVEDDSRYITSPKYAKYDLFSPFSFLASWFDFLSGGIATCTKSELDMLTLATDPSIHLERSTVVGTIGCTTVNETTCEFRFISAHPNLKQSIIFGHMILAAEAFARAKNYQRVIMYVLEARTDLKDVLTKLQFHSVQQSDNKKWLTLSHWTSTSIIAVEGYEKLLN